MALIYSSNQQPATSADSFYRLIVLLVSAGWTIASAGDGLSAYSPTNGTAVTSAGSGANGFNNTNAWIFCKMPGSNRGFVFIITSSTNVTIRYFGPSTLVTNTPSATTAPVSTTPLAASQDLVSNTNYVSTLVRSAYWADNTAPYGFGMHGWNTSGTPTFHFILEAMQASSYHPLNQDPYVTITMPNSNNSNFLVGNYSVSPRSFNNRLNSVVKCWVKYNMVGSTFYADSVVATMPTSSDPGVHDRGSFVTVGQAVSTYDGRDEEIPIQYMRIGGTLQSINYGIGSIIQWNDNIYVGIGTYVRNYMSAVTMNTSPTWTITRPNLTTLSMNGTRDRIVYGNCTVPWDGTIPIFP